MFRNLKLGLFGATFVSVVAEPLNATLNSAMNMTRAYGQGNPSDGAVFRIGVFLGAVVALVVCMRLRQENLRACLPTCRLPKMSGQEETDVEMPYKPLGPK